MLIAIDVGNSRTKYAKFNENDAQRCWAISSVSPERLAPILDWIREKHPEDEIRVLTHKDVPMRLEIESAHKLGIDRLLAAYFAAKCAEDSPIMIADFGTAITLDVVNKSGAFCGGAILPSAALMADSLNKHTSQLPALELQTDCKYPGKNTQEAIQLGIQGAIIGAVRLFEEQAEDRFGSPMPILFTGGDNAFYEKCKPMLKNRSVYVQNAVLLGIALATKNA